MSDGDPGALQYDRPAAHPPSCGCWWCEEADTDA